MQRAFKSRNCRSNCCVDVRERRRRHARRKRGRIEFVVGVEIEDRVEHPGLPLLGNFAVEFVEEICGLRQFWFFRKRLFALRDAPAVGD